METIKIDRDQLLDVLQENREKHRVEYEKAHKAWAKKIGKVMTKAEEMDDPAEGWKYLQKKMGELPKPVQYVKQYQSAIRKVEMDVRDEIELNDREFAAWVEDDWSWKGAFVAQTSLYNG